MANGIWAHHKCHFLFDTYDWAKYSQMQQVKLGVIELLIAKPRSEINLATVSINWTAFSASRQMVALQLKSTASGSFFVNFYGQKTPFG
jgi:hypothetical protein